MTGARGMLQQHCIQRLAVTALGTWRELSDQHYINTKNTPYAVSAAAAAAAAEEALRKAFSEVGWTVACS